VQLQFDLPPGAYATMALREASKELRPPSRTSHIRF
jgi:tRNA(Glu) U13 pseudouridine synthase TruD